jgi:hypothetical protein
MAASAACFSGSGSDDTVPIPHATEGRSVIHLARLAVCVAALLAAFAAQVQSLLFVRLIDSLPVVEGAND